MLGSLITLVVALIAGLVYSYNNLQRRGQVVRESHSNVLVAMRKRVDLANKLIDIARSYGEHEKLVHLTVSGNDAAAIAHAAGQVSGVMQSVTEVASRFPELKANATYQQLMGQLEQIEGLLQQRREQYNGTVRDYNTFLSAIPTCFVAPHLGFSQAPYFDDSGDGIDLKDFRTDDGEMLKQVLQQTGARVAQGSRAALEKGRVVAERGKQAYDQRQARRAAGAEEEEVEDALA